MLRHYLLHSLLVEVQGLGHIVEDADVVDDQAVRLLLAAGAVGAADGLQEVMVLHRLVEIHHLQDGRIEAGEQFAGDDDEFQRVSGIAEAVEQFFFCVFVASMLFVLAAAGVHDYSAGLRADQFVHHLLVEHAAFTVENHHLRLKTVGLHLGLVVRHHVLHHGADALRVFHQHGHLGGALGEVIAVLLGEIAGDSR